MSRSRIYLLLEVLLLACTSCATIFAVISAVRRAAVVYQVDFEEGNIVNAGLRITQGLTPYPDPHAFPNALNPYGPIPYLAVAALVKLAGVGFLYPRLLVLLSVLTITALIALVIEGEYRSWLLALAMAAAYPTIFFVQSWSAILRVDAPGIVLSLGGLVLCQRWRGRWPWAASLMAAALFVKCTLLAAPAACLADLVLRREWKRAAGFAGLLAGICGVLFAATQWWSGGYFAFHTFGTHADPFSWDHYRKFADPILPYTPHLAFPVLCYVGVMAAHRRITLPLLYLTCSAALTVTLGKLGSNSNQLLEVMAALTICAGLGLAALRDQVKPWALGLAGMLVAAVLVVNFATRVQPWRKLVAPAMNCGSAYRAVQLHGEWVLSESIGPMLLAHKPVFVSNPFVYRYLVTERGWSDAPLQTAIREKKFDLILLEHTLSESQAVGAERWSPGVVNAIAENYHVVGYFPCQDAFMALEPTRIAAAPAAAGGS